MADALTDTRPSTPAVPRYKLPELYALAAVREQNTQATGGVLGRVDDSLGERSRALENASIQA